MILLGTAILGNNRYAVLRDPTPTAVPNVPGRTLTAQAPSLMSVKLGDDVDGFKVSEIDDRRVVFTKGPAKVEVVLDYFRKQEPALSPPPRLGRAGVPAPGIVPRRPVPIPGGTFEPQVIPSPVPGQVPLRPRVLPNLPRRQRVPAAQ